MNKIIFIISFFLLLSCKTIENSINNNKISIEKIDTIGNYYVIYGHDDKSKFKIVSYNNFLYKNENIMIGKSYTLKLKPISLNIKTHAINNLDIQRCITFYPNIKIYTEPERELYISDNLFGLKYVKNPKQQYSNDVFNKILMY